MSQSKKAVAVVQAVLWADESFSLHATGIDFDACGFVSASPSADLDVAAVSAYLSDIIRRVRYCRGEGLSDPCVMTEEEAMQELPGWQRLMENGITTHRGQCVEGRIEMLMDRLRILSAEATPSSQKTPNATVADETLSPQSVCGGSEDVSALPKPEGRR